MGAGCSVSSGVPDAGTLVKAHWLPRLRDLRAPVRLDLDVWAAEIIEHYDQHRPSASYGQVIDQLFFQPEERQREIESLCDGRFPGFGYAVLSGMVTLDGGKFNVVLTTNFDDLIADALYLFTTARPLVIHHESLAGFIRPTRTRPLIVKLHGDHRLSPQNTTRETETVKNEIEASVRTLLHDRGLIFMGYGGNDKGIQKMFEALPQEALPLGVFWVSNSEPQGIVRPWLDVRNAVWVQRGDFDESMLVLRDEFQIQHPERKRFDEVFKKYTETYQALSKRINGLPDSNPEASSLKEVVRRTDQSFPDWRAASLEAKRLANDDPDQAEAIFKKGIEQFPKSGGLLAEYARFVRRVRRNKPAALSLYEQATKLDSDDPFLLADFANFLYLFVQDYDRAEAIYRSITEPDPGDYMVSVMYADFLDNARAKHDDAEKQYERTLAVYPNEAFVLVHFARFLFRVRKIRDRAKDLLLRANTIAPSDAYCLTELAILTELDGDLDQAEQYYSQALDADGGNSYPLRCYAQFLSDYRKNYEKAEEFFQRSIDADRFDPGQRVIYAHFLVDIRQEPARAQEQLDTALQLSPDDPEVLRPYIGFLREVRKDEDRAKELETRLGRLASSGH